MKSLSHYATQLPGHNAGQMPPRLQLLAAWLRYCLFAKGSAGSLTT